MCYATVNSVPLCYKISIMVNYDKIITTVRLSGSGEFHTFTPVFTNCLQNDIESIEMRAMRIMQSHTFPYPDDLKKADITRP